MSIEEVCEVNGVSITADEEPGMEDVAITEVCSETCTDADTLHTTLEWKWVAMVTSYKYS